jgi:hypothetical protein
MALDNRKETEALVNAILTKDWSELQAQEYADYLLFPEELLQRQKDGTFKRHPVMLRVPREHEMRQARIEARAWAKQGSNQISTRTCSTTWTRCARW